MTSWTLEIGPVEKECSLQRQTGLLEDGEKHPGQDKGGKEEHDLFE